LLFELGCGTSAPFWKKPLAAPQVPSGPLRPFRKLSQVARVVLR
jgi:hypothetical protein